MNTPNANAYMSHRRSGFILCAIALVFLVIGMVAILPNATTIAMICIVLAMIVWNSGINHFEQSVSFEPVASSVNELLHYSSKLKNGSEVAIAIQIQYTTENQSTQLSNLEVRIVRALDEYFPFREAIPEKSCDAVDVLLREALASEITRLHIQDFRLYTIKVDTIGAPPKSRGLVIGER